MNFKRIGRAAICLLLVCILLINASPIRAEAVVAELTLLELGSIALLVLMTCGIIFTPSSQQELESIGQSLSDHLYLSGSSAEQLDDIDSLFSVWGEAVNGSHIIEFPNRDPSSNLPVWLLISLLSWVDKFLSDDEGVSVGITDSNGNKVIPFGTLLPAGEPFYQGSAYTFSKDVYVAPYYMCTLRDDGYYSFTQGTYFFGATADDKFAAYKDGTSIHSSSTYVSTTSGRYYYISVAGTYLLEGPPAARSIAGRVDFTGKTIDMLELLTVLLEGNPLEYEPTVYDIFPELITGDIKPWVDNGGDIQTLTLPDLDFGDLITDAALPIGDLVIDLSQDIVDGVLPYPDFVDLITGGEGIVLDPDTETGTDTDPEPEPDPDTGGDSAELTWWQRFTQWFQELRDSINELPNRFDEHFENLNENIDEVPNKFESWIRNVQTSVDSVAESILGTADEINAAIQGLPDNFLSHVSVIMDAIGAVPQAVVAGLRSALEALFVPDPDFIPNKVAALQAQYTFLEPMQQTGEDLKLFFQNIGSQPPIIWIDLGAGTGWYPMGGKVKFIDLTWYSQYKPTVDPIIGGFIWLWAAWRLLHAAPGIISGAAGVVGSPIFRKEDED